MSSKQGHESLESYTDNIRVKISESYKPPPRINVPMTYAQRLTLNKQIQDNMPNYEFLLEKAVVEKMKEWRAARTTISEDKKAKLEKVKQELKKKELERIEQEKLDEVEVKTVDETVTVPNNDFNPTSSNVAFAGGTTIDHSYANYTTNSSILLPTQVGANYSNILTPIPLNNCVNQQYNCKPVDKSPFNLSDFENDTSSPFDNMELKSINDMEELAQVLKSEETKYKINTPIYQPYQSAQPTSSAHLQPNYPNYVGYSTYNIPNSTSYIQQVASDYSHTNGYYYPPDVTQNQTFHSPYVYSKPSNTDYNYTHSAPLVETKNRINSHLDNILTNPSYIRDNAIPQTSRPKSTEAIMNNRTDAKTEELDDPYNLLPKSQQDLCRSITSMGFPLSRVARTCKLLGDDHKKVAIRWMGDSSKYDSFEPVHLCSIKQIQISYKCDVMSTS
ncbi:hypothetical protein NQ314_019880 [Rhamnusium bicolor]|uniref:UMA domain-containing protein n=1 Tax=Rhamnusium bicolor TaxID=1586634 RepID=A0AAV8WM67_9CUCU|nr:hypothetical protein NQ314_019880 [Rhamnusium bicolor]